MRKKFIAVLLTVCLCTGTFVSSCFIPSETQTVYAETTTDSDWETSYPSDMTVAIESYNGTATNVVIPEKVKGYTVTSLYPRLFKNMLTTITDVTFPSTIIEIPGERFNVSSTGILNGATALTHVTIPEGVEKIGKDAFRECISLTEVELPESLTEIGKTAFYGCTSLERIVIPKNVNAIDATAFASCSSLTEIVIAEDNPNFYSVDGFIYSKDGTELIYYPASKPYTGIPDTITSIGNNVFWERSDLTKVVIPERVTQIGKYAFYECTNLTDILFSNQLTSIGSNAFSGCKNLKSIDLPDSVTSIGIDAFSKCESITDIKLPEGLSEIPMYCFTNCFSITEVILPQNLQIIGGAAFRNCKKLTHVIMPDNVTQIDFDAFGMCDALGGIHLPKNLQSMGTTVFYSTPIHNIIIPEGTVSLGTYLFASNSNLKYVIIPESVTEFGIAQTAKTGFWAQSNSKAIYCCYAGSPAEQFAIDNDIPYQLIGKDLSVSGDFIYTLNEDDTVEILGYAGGDSHMVIPAELGEKPITSIGEGNSSDKDIWVTSITLPEGITYIGDAFSEYKNLSEIYIPESVTEISESAFWGCENENFTIKGIAGSYAQQYAEENEIPWKETIPDDTEPEPEKHVHSYHAAVTKYPSCTEAGTITLTCSSCEDSYTALIPALEHQIVVDPAVEPTDMTEGKTEGSHCSLCGTIIKAQDTIPATGKEPEKHTHSYSASVTKDASCAAAGVITLTCSCGDSYTEEVPALGHQYEESIQKATLDTDGKICKICRICSDENEITVISHPQTITLSKTTYTYNGKPRTPSVIIKDGNGNALTAGTDYIVSHPKTTLDPGKYNILIEFTGNYSGTVTKTYTIKPKDTRITKVTAKSKGFQVVWKKQAAQIDGYQIQYCTNGNFTGKTTKNVQITNKSATSKQIKGLKKKQKYYVRIRTYKTVSVNNQNVKLYSDWSNTKIVRTKK